VIYVTVQMVQETLLSLYDAVPRTTVNAMLYQ
jgi:hypothetical protein